MTRWWAPAALLMLLGAAGCPGFGDKTLAELEGVETATWEADVQPILAAYCWRCHGQTASNGAPNSLFTYEQAVAQAERILVRTVQQQTMPPSGSKPTDTERALLEAWVAAGTPRGTPGVETDAAPMPDMGVEGDAGDTGDAGGIPQRPTWDAHVLPIVELNCAFAGCHAGDEPEGSLDLSTYAGFEAGGDNGDLKGGGDPAMSLLIDRLRARNGWSVMPDGGPMLPEMQIQLFEAWIAAGAPEE
jgi:mono/diheme cytochrome c family protein